MSIAIITPQKLADFCREGTKIELIDVRTPVEFREVHVEIARNVPLDQLNPAGLMQARNGTANDPLYVIMGFRHNITKSISNCIVGQVDVAWYRVNTASSMADSAIGYCGVVSCGHSERTGIGGIRHAGISARSIGRSVGGEYNSAE